MSKPILFLALLFGLTCTLDLLAQDRNKKLFPKSKNSRQQKPGDTFLDQQWYLGLRGGINLTRAVPDQRYSSISPINFESEETEKVYQDYNKVGVQIGLDFTYSWNSWSITFQPTYIRERFSYSNQSTWQDGATTGGSLEMELNQDNELEYFDLPLAVKFQFLDGPLKPFVQLGGYYGVLVNANKSASFSGTDTASGGTGTFERESFSVGASDLFLTSQAGVLGAIGFHYDPGNIRLTFDIMYRYGLHNITDRANRYSENRLVGVGDVQDDLSLRNISANLGILFPLRFLSGTFKSSS